MHSPVHVCISGNGRADSNVWEHDRQPDADQLSTYGSHKEDAVARMPSEISPDQSPNSQALLTKKSELASPPPTQVMREMIDPTASASPIKPSPIKPSPAKRTSGKCRSSPAKFKPSPSRSRHNFDRRAPPPKTGSSMYSDGMYWKKLASINYGDWVMRTIGPLKPCNPKPY